MVNTKREEGEEQDKPHKPGIGAGLSGAKKGPLCVDGPAGGEEVW